MRMGYARVSTRDQHLDTQQARLAACCEKVYLETASGFKRERPVLQQVLTKIREKDVLVICKLDRLARSTLHLYQIAETLKHEGASLEVLDQQMNTETLTGRMLFGFLALMAEFEAGLRAERQGEGIRTAQEKGIHFGRAKALTPEESMTLHEQRTSGMPVTTLSKEYGLSRNTLYRYLKDARPPAQPASSPPGFLGEAEVAD